MVATFPTPALDAGLDDALAAEDAAESALYAAVFAARGRERAAIDGLRLHRVRALGLAISICEPTDALAVMSAALEDLGAGMPCPWSDALRENALYWADTASEAELVEYSSAALARLTGAALGLAHRKRLMAALWKSLPDAERRAFLARVDPRGTFQGRRV